MGSIGGPSLPPREPSLPPRGAPPPTPGRPTMLYAVGAGEGAPAAGDTWIVPLAQQNFFRTDFEALDKEKNGFIDPAAAKKAFSLSGLDRNRLAHAWDLSDFQKSGYFDAECYILAMYIIQLYKRGLPVPDRLPPDWVPPSYR